MNLDRITSRKFILSVLTLLLTSLLCWFKKIDAGVYGWLIAATVGAYITGNVVQKKVQDDPA